MKQGLYGWIGRNLRGRKSQRGFTLIELLVVVTILGILAAIVTLSLVGLTTNANVNACNTEYKTVQAAIDAYMASPANNFQATLPGAQVAFTNDMSGGVLPIAQGNNPGTVKLYVANPTTAGQPNFTRNGTTQYFYTWDQFGRINGISASVGGAPVPNCVPK